MEIIIRAYEDHDFETLEKIRNDFELQYLLLSNPKPNTKARVINWIENKTAGDNSVFFVISNKKNETIGYVQAVGLDLLNRNCYFGVAISKNWQGKGVFTKAVLLLEQYLKDTFNIKKIVGELLVSNINSIKALEKTGYLQVGLLKEHFYCKSAFHDVCIIEKIL